MVHDSGVVLRMTLTKQQKVFIGIFVCVLVGLVCDRTLLLPEGVGAETVQDNRIERPPISAMTMPSLPTTPAASAQFKERLDALLPDDDPVMTAARDAFTLSAAWSGGRKQNVEGSEVSKFRKKHRLKALILHGRGQAAFVDEEFVRIGQVLDGFQLVELDENSATFVAEGKFGGGRVILEINRTRPDAPAALD